MFSCQCAGGSEREASEGLCGQRSTADDQCVVLFYFFARLLRTLRCTIVNPETAEACG
jgi:hypothetical protein